MLLDCCGILQSQATSIVLLDRQFCVQYLNESAESMLNSSLNRARGLSVSDLLRDADQVRNACSKVLNGQGEIRLRNHQLLLPSVAAEMQVDCVINRVDMDGTAMLLIEVSEVETLHKLAREEEFIQRQQSNQAVIRGLAHEIRNPLGGIRGAAQLLSDEIGGEGFDEYTRIIIHEADRLTNLVDRMQAQTTADLDQQVNIHSVIEHVRQLVLADGNPKFSFRQDYDPSLPPVRGNSELLIQALINVIRNAADAVENRGSDGEVLLRTRIDHTAADGVKKQVVRVDVVDNGPGISPEIAPRIFDPMVTGKVDGTGLGLPISAEIITQHGGAVDFQSNGETTFRIYLPVHSPLS